MRRRLLSTIRSTAWRKRGTTNDPVSSCRRRCHRHCHHCCNWRDPWHRTLALARDLSARQLILAAHTIAFAKPLNLALRVSLQEASCDGDYFSFTRIFQHCMALNKCLAERNKSEGRGSATKRHDNDFAQISFRGPMHPVGRNGR